MVVGSSDATPGDLGEAATVVIVPQSTAMEGTGRDVLGCAVDVGDGQVRDVDACVTTSTLCCCWRALGKMHMTGVALHCLPGKVQCQRDVGGHVSLANQHHWGHAVRLNCRRRRCGVQLRRGALRPLSAGRILPTTVELDAGARCRLGTPTGVEATEARFALAGCVPCC